MIKSILGGKSKNLFDISKAEITQHNVYWTSNADFTQHFYTQIVEPGKTYTVSYEYYNPLAGNDALSLSVQTGSGFYEGTRLYTGLIGNGKYKWVKQYGVFTIPNGVTQVTLSAFYDTMFRNLQLELGSTATEYVPHELTSYKSIMKVGNGRFVTSYDERMPCKTKNLFDKSNAQIINGYISASNVFSTSALDKTIIIPCLPNTTYTFSKISVSPVNCDRLRIGDYTAIPAIGDTINNVVNIGEPNTQNYITITTSDTAKYIVVTIGVFKPTVITTLDYILNTCQLELGTTATDYVPYGYV